MYLLSLFLMVFGLSSGIIVGSGVVAILTLVGTIPRMAQVSKTKEYIYIYECLLIIGTFLGSLISIQNMGISLSKFEVVVCGIAYGIFVGFLSSGLTEILDYIPVVTRRLKIPIIYFKYIIISMLLGKVIGSLIGWYIIKGGK